MRLVRPLLLALSVWTSSTTAWAGAPLQEASKEQWSAAQKAFEIADELYDAGNYAEAVTAYRASYDIVQSPNSRLMIARSLQQQGELDAAFEEFQRTIDEGSVAATHDEKYLKTVDAARTDLDALLRKAGRLTIVLKNPSSGTIVIVNGREILAERLGRPLVVPPGRVTIGVSTASGPAARQEIELRIGEQRTLSIDAGRPLSSEPGASLPAHATAPATSNTPNGTLRTLTWVSVGVGAAGLATFAIFGALNNDAYSDLSSECVDRRCTPEQEDDIEAGQRFQTAANVGLGVSVAGLGAAATLWLFSRESSRASASRLPQLAVTPSSAQVGWQGRF
jgi:hypothetical protein